jgi:hypothetical protein
MPETDPFEDTRSVVTGSIAEPANRKLISFERVDRHEHGLRAARLNKWPSTSKCDGVTGTALARHTVTRTVCTGKGPIVLSQTCDSVTATRDGCDSHL